MRSAHRSLVASLALVLAAGACSDSPVQPVEETTLSSALAEMSLSEVLPGGIGVAAPVPSAALVPSGCAYSVTSQGFVCAPVTTNGLTINQGYTLLSASNAPQQAFDRATTAAVRGTMSIVGTVTTGGEAITVDLQQVMTLSGLLTGTHVLDGTQVVHLGTPPGSPYPLVEDISTTITGLVLPPRGSSNPYPRAGSIAMTILDGPAGAPSTTTFALTMVFNGTSKVAVTFTVDGVTTHCTIDLAATTNQGACA
jgi:hypothetical protein